MCFTGCFQSSGLVTAALTAAMLAGCGGGGDPQVESGALQSALPQQAASQAEGSSGPPAPAVTISESPASAAGRYDPLLQSQHAGLAKLARLQCGGRNDASARSDGESSTLKAQRLRSFCEGLTDSD